MTTNKKGFSLIELSIVLIIIGLLVAGITGGASLIRSAELRSVMTEIRNNQTAVNAYYTATEQLPGTSGTTSQIAFTSSCAAWEQMVEEGVIDADIDCSSTSPLSTANSLNSKLKGSLYAIGYNTEMDENVIAITASGETPAKLTAMGNTTLAFAAKPAITREDAKFLDDKIDNGIYNSGKVQSFSTSEEATPPTEASCKYDNATALTNAQATTKDCATAISIGL